MADERTTGPASGPEAAREIGEAGREAREATRQAASEVGRAVKDEAGRQAEHGKERVSDTLDRLASEIDSAAQSLSDDDAWAREALRRGAGALHSASDYLSGKRVNTLLQDSQEFARRNPTAYFSASVATGFVLARIAKTAALRAQQATPEARASQHPAGMHQGGMQ